MRIYFRSRALRDIEEARLWYGAESPDLEIRFARALLGACAIILEYPNAFQRVQPGVRHVSVPGFPYLIYYLSEEENITVLRILHMKRHPETFLAR